MIKAIFFDIDGTLVPFGHHEVLPSTRDAIRQLREKGVLTFISTGRHPKWIDNLGDTKFDGYVTTNGALCLLADEKTVVFCNEIPQEDIQRLVEFTKHSDMVFVVVPADGEIFATGINDNFRKAAEMLHIPPISIKPIENALGQPIVQLMCFADQTDIEASGLFETTLTDCESMSWCPLFCDIIKRGTNKSIGMDEMARYNGFSQDETMAFGDGHNDIGMIRHAKIGVAMGQASDDVKREADYVTAPCDQDGIMKALKHFNLL